MTISLQAAIIAGLFVLASVALNAVLIYYTRISIMKFTEISAGMLALRESVNDFSNHLEFVYELEMYYGDETLKGLIEHARSLNESLEEYEEFYDLFDFPEEQSEDESEEEEVDATQT